MDEAGIMSAWLSKDGRSRIMHLMRDMEIYEPMVDRAGDLFVQFEREKMVPMFQRVRDAIRTVDDKHIIFLETSMSANMGIPTGVDVVRDEAGKPDTLQAYAPHGYDIVVDTPDRPNPSLDRLNLIFSRHAKTAQRMDVPILIGEWGAYGNISPDIIPGARHLVGLMEKYHMSDTYWEYGRYVIDPNCVYREILQRPYPQRVAGTLRNYETDFEALTFACTWKEDGDITAPTHIYVPARFNLKNREVIRTPKDSTYSLKAVTDTAGDLYIIIPPTGKKGKRSLRIGDAAE